MQATTRFLLIALLSALFASCQYHKVDDNSWKIRLGNTSNTITLDKRIYAYSAYGGLWLEAGTTVHVRARVAYDGDEGTLIETPSRMRYVTYYDIGAARQGQIVDIGHRHFLPYSDMTGRNITEVTKRLAHYVYADTVSRGQSRFVFSYPHVNMVRGKRYYRGVNFVADGDMNVVEVQPIITQENAFGKLPFYGKILELNLLEPFSPPLMIDDAADSTPRHGAIGGIFSGTLDFMAALVPVALLMFLAFKFTRGYLWVSLAAAASLVWGYVWGIALLDAYHNSWWVLVLVYAFCLMLCGSSALGMRVAVDLLKCPKCGKTNWKSVFDEDRTRSQEFRVRRHITYGTDASGCACILSMKRRIVRTEPVIHREVCQNCHYEKEPKREVRETSLPSDVCPKCGKGHLSWTVRNKEVTGLHFAGVLVDRCSECDYYQEERLSYHVTGQSAPRSVARNDKKTDMRSNVPTRGNCYDCYWYRGSSCAKQNMVGRQESYGTHGYCPYWKSWQNP